ncbi:MAG: SpoIIE family protein phosphatase [Sedimentisphaerales bacterium]|nr:SpoIIE family protein phosphatase [Sedimentisphaerales bacterium]
MKNARRNTRQGPRDRDLLNHAVEATVRLDRKVRRLNQDLSSVHEASRLLTGPMDLEQVLEIVVRTVAQALDADAAGLRLLTPETGELTLKATFGLSDAYINKGPVTAGESKLNRRALKGEPIVVEDMRHSKYFSRYHDNIMREGLVSSLTVGMLYKDSPIGMLRLYSKRPRTFSPQDIALAQIIAAQSAAAIVNARLYREALEKQRLDRQLKIAGEVQRHLIPHHLPDIPGLDIGARYVPCYEVGGDLYDFIPLPDGRLLVVLGDVMGKGVPASLAMASTRSCLRAYAECIKDLPELMRRVNRMFCIDTAAGEFATLFCALFEPGGEALSYCNAGHDPGLLFHGEDVQRLTAGGPLMGVDPKADYELGCSAFHTGDMLLCYTDGLAEAMNFEREPFGRERIIQAARDSLSLTADQSARSILWTMRKFTGLTSRFDDTALIVVKKR